MNHYGIAEKPSKSEEKQHSEHGEHAQDPSGNNGISLDVLTTELDSKQREIGYLLSKIDEKDSKIESLHVELREVSGEVKLLEGISNSGGDQIAS